MAYDLKKESDVKEYIEKLGVEYRFGCYSEKNPEVCHLLGDYLEGIKKDFEKAAKVYKSTCDDYGYAKSCYKFGNYSFLGKGKSGNKGDPKAAYSYYEKGCNLNDSDSCLHSGLLLVSRSMPKEIDRDVKKGIFGRVYPTIGNSLVFIDQCGRSLNYCVAAIIHMIKSLKYDAIIYFPFGVGLEFLTKSCDMNNATACFYLSGMHISGVQKKAEEFNPHSPQGQAAQKAAKDSDYVVLKDMKKAFEFAYKACELRNMYACANLSQMYARGDGTEKNDKEAEKYKKIALEMQEEIKKQQQTLEFQQGLKNTQ